MRSYPRPSSVDPSRRAHVSGKRVGKVGEGGSPVPASRTVNSTSPGSRESPATPCGLLDGAAVRDVRRAGRAGRRRVRSRLRCRGRARRRSRRVGARRDEDRPAAIEEARERCSANASRCASGLPASSSSAWSIARTCGVFEGAPEGEDAFPARTNDLDRASSRAHARQHAGQHQRRLPRPRGARDRDDRSRGHSLQHGLDVVVASEEDVGVVGAECAEPGVGAARRRPTGSHAKEHPARDRGGGWRARGP